MARKKTDEVEIETNNKLQDTLNAIQKKFGNNTIMRAAEIVDTSSIRIPSGVFLLDIAIGGGIPKGRTLIYKGEPSSGKTSVALMNVASFQKRCRECNTLIEGGCSCGKNIPHRCAYIDVEGTFDTEWATAIGVNTLDLLLSQPEYGEQSVDILEALIRSGEIDLIIVDSLAAIVPMVEVENDAEKQTMGIHARLINKMCRAISSGLNSLGMTNEQKPSIILINQIREKLGIMWGNPETMPGGKGQNFTSSITIHFTKKETLTDDKSKTGSPVGVRTEFYVEKNKTFVPFQRGSFELYQVTDNDLNIRKGSVNNPAQVVQYATNIGLIQQKGAWYFYPSAELAEVKASGLENFIAEILSNPEIYSTIQEEVRTEVKSRFRV